MNKQQLFSGPNLQEKNELNLDFDFEMCHSCCSCCGK